MRRGETLALPRDHPVVLATGGLIGGAVHLEGLAEHADQGEGGLEVVGDVGHEIRLEPRHLGLAPHEAVGSPEPERDHADEQAEGGGEQPRLTVHGVAGGQPRGFVEGEAPGRERLAEGDTEHVLGVIQRSRGVDGAIGPVDHRQHALPLEAGQRLLEDLPPQALLTAQQHGEQRLVEPFHEHRRARHALAQRDVAAAAPIPEAGRDLAADLLEGGRGPLAR
jgi:hypothetical protein